MLTRPKNNLRIQLIELQNPKLVSYTHDLDETLNTIMENNHIV